MSQTIMFFSHYSLIYLDLSMGMLEKQCSLQKSVHLCMHMHICLCVYADFLVLDQVPAMRYSEMNGHCMVFWKCQESCGFLLDL